MDFEPTPLLGEPFSWSSQVCQYREAQPPEKIPGVSYFAGPTEYGDVDCLLYWERTSGGRPMIVGILNHYGFDAPGLEKAGNVNVWVRPSHQRRGVGTALVMAAEAMFGPLNFNQQRYSESGAGLARKILSQRPASAGGSSSKG